MNIVMPVVGVGKKNILDGEKNKMNDKRPRLDNPEEYAIIKSIYFKDDRPLYEDLDPLERLNRMEAKQRHQNKSSR